jgi:predicted nucleic acid-binding protein
MIVLDTNVISEMMRQPGAPEVVRWVGQQVRAELFTTAITESEIFLGIELVSKGRRRDQLLADAEGMFGEDMAGRILTFDSRAARAFAGILGQRRRLGRPIGHADAQIAAIAQVHHAAVATRDVDDFAHCDIRVIDPWER